MKRRYVTVQVDTEVDVALNEILDGMSNEDKRELLRQIEKDLRNAVSGPRATVSLADAILARHREEHEGPVWACRDSVCDAWAVGVEG